VFAAVGVTTRVVVSPEAYAQLVLERREAAAAVPPVPADPIPAPDTAKARLRDQVGLQQAVWLTVQHLEPCTNAQVKEALGERRAVTHQALQALVKHGKVVKAGETYRVVPALQAAGGVGVTGEKAIHGE
jgi:hypothetical protein